MTAAPHDEQSPFAPPRISWWVVPGTLLGLLIGGGSGAWDAWATFHSKERQDAEIRSALEGPHPDGARFYARVYAVRYQSLGSLIAWRSTRAALFGALLGGFLGLFAWMTVAALRERRAKRAGVEVPKQPPTRFTLTDLLVILAVSGGLATLLLEGPSGLVYHNGKDQTRWLLQLHSTDPAERAEAVNAVSHILDHHRCYCREATIDRLAKIGASARPAVPAMRRLAEREPEFRERVEKAIRAIENPQPEPNP